MFAQWDKKDTPGAALGIFNDGRIIYARGYGMANLEYNIPITPQSVFRIASVSKQFTAMCIAILAEQGKLSLDDDIRKYVGEMPAYDTPVSIRHLIHHISGVRDYLTLQGLRGMGGGYFYTPQDVIDLLSHQKELNFKPGDEYLYSNAGYFLLAEIIGRASGLETAEFAEKYIFEPLEMNGTHFHNDRSMIVKNRASGYSAVREGGYRINMTQLEMIGDGGIYTTIEDFFKWDQNFYNNKLGKGAQDLIDMVLTRGKLNNGEEISYAFGLNVGTDRGLKKISHGGSFVGFRSTYIQYPDQKFSVVIFTNNSISPGGIAGKIADLYLAEQFTELPPARQERQPRQQRTPQARPEPVALSASQMRDYAGEYYSDELDVTYVISIENDTLVVGYGRVTGSRITAASTDQFRMGSQRMEFVRDSQNRITGFIMQAGRVQNLKFEKVK
ncbi:hypothetical protein AMJ80_11040 [bacterium SM23_31]|nr:MAG: hypothetical protein AMJ80_11040 [bacterium SM23_31]